MGFKGVKLYRHVFLVLAIFAVFAGRSYLKVQPRTLQLTQFIPCIVTFDVRSSKVVTTVASGSVESCRLFRCTKYNSSEMNISSVLCFLAKLPDKSVIIDPS